jgi:hypothetical protein
MRHHPLHKHLRFHHLHLLLLPHYPFHGMRKRRMRKPCFNEPWQKVYRKKRGDNDGKPVNKNLVSYDPVFALFDIPRILWWIFG